MPTGKCEFHFQIILNSENLNCSLYYNDKDYEFDNSGVSRVHCI